MRHYLMGFVLLFISTPFVYGAEYADNRLIIKFKETPGIVTGTRAGLTAVDNILQGEIVTSLAKALPAAAVADPLGLARVYEVVFAAPVDVADLVKRLSDLPEVEYAEPRYIAKISANAPAGPSTSSGHGPTATPNDPAYSANQAYLPLIQAPAAWDIAKGRPETIIAVVDNGTDWRHEDLLANHWQNQAELTGQPGRDDDGNGYVDDIDGYDFIDKDGDPTPSSGVTHGTHVGGIAAAVTNNGRGVASVSWNCRLMAIRSGTGTSVSFGYEGIHYAAHSGAHVISCSWSGGGASRFEREVIADALAQGAVILAAAGNDGNDLLNYPAAYENVIAVGATDSGDRKASYSNYGTWLSVCAPGTIYSTFPSNQYTTISGTSMATPMVAGLCGLIKSYHPDWDNYQIAAQAILSADNLDAKNPSYIGKLGSGRINALRALTETFNALIMTNFTVNDGGSGFTPNGLEPGETVDAFVAVRSLFSTMSNVTVRLTTTDSYITFLTNQVTYGNLAVGQTVTNSQPFRIQAASNMPYGHVIEFNIILSAGAYQAQKTYRYLVQPLIGDHTVGDVRMTLTSEGEFGFWKATADVAQGSGFVYPANGGQNLIFSGTFAVGTDANYVADAFFNDGTAAGNDWAVDEVNNGVLYFNTENGIPQVGHAVFADTNHPSSKNLHVKLESWAFEDSDNDDYIILNYTLQNFGSQSISNLYTGVFADWDMGSSAQDDEGGVDAVNKVVWQRGNDYNVYVGMAVGSITQTQNLSVIDNETYIYPSSTLTDNSMIQFLNGQLHFETSPDKDDYSLGCSAKPRSLLPGGAATVSFILAAGDNLNHLLTNIAAARAKLDVLLDVEISDFTAQVSGENVALNWDILASEDVAGYNILRTRRFETGTPAQINNTLILIDTYVDTSAETGYEYGYWIEVVKSAGQTLRFGPVYVQVGRPRLTLTSSSPNPFSDKTRLQFSLPTAGAAKLRIYNAGGQLVRILDGESFNAGVNVVEWDGRNDDARQVSGGIYFLRLEQNGRKANQKIIRLGN